MVSEGCQSLSAEVEITGIWVNQKEEAQQSHADKLWAQTQTKLLAAVNTRLLRVNDILPRL